MRSFLTTLGIIIGVGAVIAMVAIGEGAKAQRRGRRSPRWAPNLLIVLPGLDDARAARTAASARMPTLTWDDLAAIRTRGAGGALRGARSCARARRSSSEDQNWTHAASPARRPSTSTSATGRSRAARASRRRDVDGGAKVVVLGQTVVDKLFGAERRSGRAARCASRTSRSRSSACSSARASRRWGRTTTTRRSSRSRRSRPRSRAACSSYIAGAIIVERHRAPTTTRARRAQITDAAARPPPPRRRRRRRLLDPQPDRDRRARSSRARKTLTTLLASDRRGVAARRRHRHHEHHAGQRHRADARDRHAHGGRRASRATSSRSSWSRRWRCRSAGGLHRHRARRLVARERLAAQLRLADADPARHHRASRSASARWSASSSGSTRRARRRGSIRSTRCGSNERRAFARMALARSARRWRRRRARGGRDPERCRRADARRRARAAREHQPDLRAAHSNTSRPRRASTRRARTCCRRSTPTRRTRARPRNYAPAPSTALGSAASIATTFNTAELLSQQRERSQLLWDFGQTRASATRPRPALTRRSTPRRRQALTIDLESALRVLHASTARSAVDVARETLDNQNKHLRADPGVRRSRHGTRRSICCRRASTRPTPRCSSSTRRTTTRRRARC